MIVLRDRCAPAAAPDAAVRRCPQPAQLGRATAECGRHRACWSRLLALRRRRHSVLPCCAVLRQCSWGERLQGADDTWRACLARSHRISGGTRCCRAELPSASAARESNCGAQMARGLLVSRDRNTPAAAPDAALLRRPPPVRLGRATAECGRRTWRARLTASAAASDAAVLRCPPPAWLGRATAERGRHMACSSRAIGMSRALPAVALVAAVRRCPQLALLGRSAAERGRHVECSSCAIATRRRPYSVLPGGAALRGERLQCADGT